MLIVVYTSIVPCCCLDIFEHVILEGENVLDERELILEAHCFKDGMGGSRLENTLDQISKLSPANQLKEAFEVLLTPKVAS